MPKRSSRPRDTNQLAKFITDVATGVVELPKTDDGKDPAAVALGRKGGLKGGKARADPFPRNGGKKSLRGCGSAGERSNPLLLRDPPSRSSDTAKV